MTAAAGQVAALWRYPVKSMAGEALDCAYLGFGGLYGDRVHAIARRDARPGFPFLTARDRPEMLLYRPTWRHPARMTLPPNHAEAAALPPGITPVYADAAEQGVDIATPGGPVLAIEDPALLAMLGGDGLTLLRSDRALTDCRPVSLLSLGTLAQLAAELSMALDARRFRANIQLDLGAAGGFAEDGWIGRRLRIGPQAVVAVLDRDPRCKMITIDPDDASLSPQVLRHVARAHQGKAGVYAAVLAEGVVRPGDAVEPI